MANPTQTDRVLARLRKGPLTQMEALVELGVMRLGARILELRDQGFDITTTTVEVDTRVTGEKARVARYSLPPCGHVWVAQEGAWETQRCEVCGIVTAKPVVFELQQPEGRA